MKIYVTKRNGSKELFDAEKINKIVGWATDGIADVNPSDVVMRANLYMADGITTAEIHQALVDAASDFIDEDNINYSKVAARLSLYQLRKEVWGGKIPPTLYDLIEKNVKAGYYDSAILEKYSKAEIDKLGEIINHAKDENFGIGGLTQMRSKYLIQNRKTKEIRETPQFAFMLIAMVLFANEPKNRLEYVKNYYFSLQRKKINAPTPVLAGARSRTRSYSSCCLIDVNDTKESIFAALTAVGMATCDKYGIGVNLGKMRPVNSPIRGGETLHSGVIPWLKMFQETIAACQQGGARRGAATINFPIFHPEIETILQLKNNQGTHENRVPHLDYCIGMSRLFWQRYLSFGEISLFSPQDAPELYDRFGMPDFDELYLKYEASDIPRKTIPMEDLLTLLFVERIESARIYILNVDEANVNSPWIDQVSMTNLCVEILQVLEAIQSSQDEFAEIGVCVIGAINMLNIKDDKDLEEQCALIVRSLDNVIDNQEYTVPACERFAKRKRSLGIGVSNLSAWLASKGLNQNSPEAPQVISDYMEKQQYYLLKASCELAKERGAAPDFHMTKYSQGFMPVDMYNKNVDEFLVPFKLSFELWQELKENIAKYGLRHCTLSAQPPIESSSVVQEATNGVEPITALVTGKSSITKTAIVIAPNAKKWKKYYLKKEDIKNDNLGIIKSCAAIIKWLDMGLSLNLYYDSLFYPDGQVPLSHVIREHLIATKYGHKTFYYLNSKKKKDSTANMKLEVAKNEEVEVEEVSGCAGGACTL